jgi:carboxymethylenebutenolidase
MAGTDVKIKSAGGGEFESYVALPASGPAPGVILAAAVFGVDADQRKITEDFAAQGFCASSPDFFWRSDPGPLGRTEEDMKRARARAQPRHQLIEQGVQDLADAVADLKARPECNGRVAVAGFCYGGPYALIGPARLGLDAGFAYHGTNLQDWVEELDRVNAPVGLFWGTEDHAAPPEVLELFKSKAATHDHLELHVYPGIGHGYTAPSANTWDAETAKHSWTRTYDILDALR